VEETITPLQWEHEYNVYEGATFNLAHNLSQMLYFRPHNKFEELRNLYLVGGGTHPGSGLPTIYISGLVTAGLISKEYGLRLARKQ
jgi:phytoene desaturase